MISMLEGQSEYRRRQRDIPFVRRACLCVPARIHIRGHPPDV